MKKALSIIMVLIIMLSLFPIAFAELTVSVKSGGEDVPASLDKWALDSENSLIIIKDASIDEVTISAGSNVTLSFAADVTPSKVFTVKNSTQGLTIKPAVIMPKGLRIVKNADYPITVQFDPTKDTVIGNGLFIQPGEGATLTLEDLLVSNGKTVSISLTASDSAETLDNAIAAVNTSGSLQFKQSGSAAAKFAITTNSPEAILDGKHICAVNASNLKVGSGVTLSATVTGGTDANNTAAVFATKLNNSGTVKASVGSGAAALYAENMDFEDGVIEATNPSGNAVTISAILHVNENAKAIVGDDADNAAEIQDLKNSDAYKDKKYVKIYIPVPCVKLDKETLPLEVGQTDTLTATTVPSTATIVSWELASSEFIELATSAADKKTCTVSAKKATTTPVTVTVKDSNGNEDSCEVTVVPYIPPVPPTKLNITDPVSSCTFTATGDEHWFIASLLPENSDKSGYTIDWVSSNPNVAKVADIKENGTTARIVSVAAGTCDITARCEALGLSSVRTVSVMSDFRFTSNNKLVFYYDNRSKTDCNFATTIPADMVNMVTVNGYSIPFYKDSKGNISILYSSLLNTFGTKSARMPLRVYYGEGSNQYIEKTLYYMSIYDAPLTADTDMTWAYVTMLVSGLFISASPWVAKRAKRRGASQ